MKYFYHPENGYWETITEPSEAVLATYPEGTIEVAKRPSSQHQMIEGVWVFVDKTPEQLEEELQTWRNSVSISRRDFCIKAYEAGLLSEEDAVTAAKGDWPSAFTSALSGLTSSEIVAAKIEWASATLVRRNAPLLETVRASQDISENVVDAIFGLVEQQLKDFNYG